MTRQHFFQGFWIFLYSLQFVCFEKMKNLQSLQSGRSVVWVSRKVSSRFTPRVFQGLRWWLIRSVRVSLTPIIRTALGQHILSNDPFSETVMDHWPQTCGWHPLKPGSVCLRDLWPSLALTSDWWDQPDKPCKCWILKSPFPCEF